MNPAAVSAAQPATEAGDSGVIKLMLLILPVTREPGGISVFEICLQSSLERA